MNLSLKFTSFLVLIAFALVGILGSELSAQALIYEPFDDSDSPLNGNTSGLGLTGNWSAGNDWTVTSGSYSIPGLPTSGNKAEIFNNRTSANALIGTTLSDAGLMADGATLWFSTVMLTNSALGINPDFGFALGNANLQGSNNIPMAGQGVGITLKQGQFQATTWDDSDSNNASQRSGGLGGLSTGTPYLLVGEVIWGSGGADDIVNLYAPDAGLDLGSVVSTFSADLDQSTFDRLTFANKADNLPVGIDEIRFGATSNDVLGIESAVVPEPASIAIWLLLGLGLSLFGYARVKRS